MEKNATSATKKPLIIFIEGNIGAGKTTFLKLLENSGYFNEKYPNKKIAYVYEPVNEWTEYKDSNGKDILTYFYEDQSRYGFSFQWYVFMTRIRAINKAIEAGADILFVERSIFTDRNVFMKSLYEKGKLSEIEHKMYNDWFDWISAKFLINNYKFVYLYLSTEECYNRILKRSRDAEAVIEYDYLDLINKNHDTWLTTYDEKKCVMLSSEYSPDSETQVNEYLQKIEKLI